jgi:hypothetical protein
VKDNDRVVVLEPRTDLPASAMPVLRTVLDEGRKRWQNQAMVTALLLLLGLLSFFLHIGIAVPVFFVVLALPFLTVMAWIGLMYARGRKLLGFFFRPLHPASEDILVSGAKVSLPLDDEKTEWLVVRLPNPIRLQLAGQRRVWVLGPNRHGHVFAQLPGRVTLYPARLRPAPLAGSEPLPPVRREPTTPNEDPVLKAHMRYLGLQAGLVAGFYLVLAGFVFWVLADFPAQPAYRYVAIAVAAPLLAVVLVVAAVVTWWLNFRNGWRLDGTWTELRIVTDGRVQVSPNMLAKLSGRTVLPDGREVTFRLSYVEPSLAGNVSVSKQLWIAGVPRAGKTARAAVPGYPVFGSVRFGTASPH